VSMIERKCRSEGVVFLVVAVVEKSVVATAVACVSVSVFGAGGRRSSCRVEYYAAQAGRQAEPKQAASSKQAKARQGMDRGNQMLWLVVQSRVLVRRGCVRADVYYLMPLLDTLSISLSLSLPIFRSSCPLIHTSLAPNHPTHTARQAFAGLALRWAGSKAQARGSRLARPRSELCTRQTTTQTLSASCSAFRSPKGLDNDALLTAAGGWNTVVPLGPSARRRTAAANS
jgi:hypothetical protein